MLKIKLNIFFLIIATFIMSHTYAETGVTKTEIIIGMSNALSGPAQGLGKNVKVGAMAYFNKINKAGGVHGRKIKIISYDDGYEPKKAAENTKKLIEEDKVFALFGFVGTPTSKAVVPIASRANVPYIAPFTGAEFLRTPVNKNVFNVRASYFDETEMLVNHIINDLGIKEIGVFIQDDGYGAAGRAGVSRALRKNGLKIAGEGKYKRNTTQIQKGLDQLIAAKPKAIIMVGAYKACAAFLKEAKKKGFSAKFFNISFVGVDNLYKEAGNAADNTYVSQVVPNYADSTLDIINSFKKDVPKNHSFAALEGYIDAIVLVKGLQEAGQKLTRESLRKAMQNLKFSFKGINFSFSSKKHQALNKVYLTKLSGGKIITVNKLD